jgi:2,3-dihydroxybenzoate decarboxylase
MENIALEECFGIPELAERRSDALSGIRLRRSCMSEAHSRLSDFTEYRLPEMDDYSIAVQVLSWVTPGTQYPGLSPQEAIDDARYANDYLASVVAAHPDRFRGFAALPMQDPAAAVDELTRCVGEHGFVGALVNDHTQGHYLDEQQYEHFWATLARLGVPLYIHRGHRQRIAGTCWRAARSCTAPHGVGLPRYRATRCGLSLVGCLIGTRRPR